MVDKIKGGLADNKSLQDIADKHSVSLSVIESALADGIKVEREHTESDEQAEEIAKDHLFEDAEYYSKLAKVEKQNSKDWAKTYKASNFIEKGVCTYNDETIYLSQEALNNAIQSIKGRPVVIKHQKVTPQNMEDHAVGYVSDCGFCSDDASFYCNFLVFDDEGKEVIAKDYSVSCAYLPKAFGKGGTWHNTPYDREVTELEFTHLALVPDPRYEDAKIYENAMDKNMDKKGKWITIRGTHVFIEEGQDVQEALDKQFNKKEIEFTGKNTKDLKELLGDNLRVSDNGKITVNTEKGNITILKEDKVTIDGNNIEIKKPSYVGGKPIIAKLKDNKSFDYVDDGEKIQIIKDDNNKYHIHYGVDKEGKATSKASGFETLEEAEKTLKKHRPNYTEKQNSTDNTTKETYNMEKIEVEQGFLASLIELAQKPFMNSKKEEEPKEEEKIEKDDDELEYEGKKYSKKELVNAFESACAGKKAKEEKEMKNEKEAEEEVEVEKENSVDADDDIEFFNSMQALMAKAQSDASDKVEIPSQTKGLELGSKAFG